MATRWAGPISAAVLLPRGEDLDSILDGRAFDARVRLLPVSSAADASSADNASPYPINRLRNVALASVRTTHFLVLDVDVWPSHELLAAILHAPPALLKSRYAALVIPAFQLDVTPPSAEETAAGEQQGSAAAATSFFEANFDRVPSRPLELKECLEAGRCSTFYSKTSPETHGTTPYRDWWGAVEPLPIPCFRSARYEPYLLLPNLPSTPIYSEAFVGYGKNKIQLITHLRFAGFKFHALPRAFVVHMPHVKSAQKVAWEAGALRHEMDRKYQRLVAELIAEHQRPRTPSCHPGRLL